MKEIQERALQLVCRDDGRELEQMKEKLSTIDQRNGNCK